jgi:FkbM family methyltransferase
VSEDTNDGTSARQKPPKTGTARTERVLKSIRTLGLKTQLQLFDSIKDTLTVEGPHGIRFSLRSTLEYKRSTKDKPWDAPLMDWIASFKGGDVFYDIGANTGAFSLVAAKLHGRNVLIYSFEPGFESFEALMRNILVNDLSAAITACQVGLSDRTSIESFNYRTMGAGSAMHSLGMAVDPSNQPFEPIAVQPVLAFTLDDFVDRFEIPRPTRVKLDVDGTEARVLAGGRRTLSAGACEVWIEVSEGRPADPAAAEVMHLLRDLGFTQMRELNHDAPPGTYPRVYDALFVRR